MITQSFEIKVALLGYVSVGKTTVLNALLQDKFSEVSMRRTTAGVNFFRIVTTAAAAAKDTTAAAMKDDNIMAWSLLADEPLHTAPSALEEITRENQKLREQTSVIQEKTFNVELNHPICEMRKDTTLILVDIPGLNEADSKNMYLNYVSDQWDTFDCVVVVMDAEKGVNTEEQVELLKLVRTKLETTKNVPVLVLCNKVDDTEDEELMEMVKEVRTKVEGIFKEMPLSTVRQRGSLERFQELDLKLIDKIGHDEVGRNNWKKKTRDEKYAIVYDAVSDSTKYQERLESTNFDKFLTALKHSIGGDEVQRVLLERQIEISLQKLSVNSPVVTQLRSIYDKCKAIEQNPGHLKQYFWKAFGKIRGAAIAELQSNIYPSFLADAMDQLIKYGEFVRTIGWNDEEGEIVKEMVALVGSQIGTVCQKQSEWKINDAVISWHPGAHFPWDWKRDKAEHGWRNIHNNEFADGDANPASVDLNWKSLTYHDWSNIIGALLLLASNQHVVERFGRERLLLEKLLQKHTQYANCMASSNNVAEKNAMAHTLKFTTGRYEDDKFVPNDQRKYDLVVQVDTPELISDRSHWGHVIWKFCNFMSKLEKS